MIFCTVLGKNMEYAGGIGVLSYLMAWLGRSDYRPEWVFSLEFLGGAGVPECR